MHDILRRDAAPRADVDPVAGEIGPCGEADGAAVIEDDGLHIM